MFTSPKILLLVAAANAASAALTNAWFAVLDQLISGQLHFGTEVAPGDVRADRQNRKASTL